MGEPKEVRPGRGGFHENPSTCICEDSVAKLDKNHGPKKYVKDNVATKKNVGNDEVDVDDNDNDDNDDDYDQNDLTDKDMFNETMSDYETLNFEDPELEEIISD